MKKILVFGGTGFLGSYVVNELENKGFDVTAADISLSEYIDEKKFQKCDILKIDEINSIVDQGFDYVFNFAGFSNLDKAVSYPIDTLNLNVIGNLNILEAIKGKNIKRFLFASSSYAMNNKGSFYGISKLTSEKIIEEYSKVYNLDFTIIRYGSVYSERNFENNYIYNVIREAIFEKKIVHDGDGEEIREYIHAADAARLSVEIMLNEEFKNEHIILTGLERMKRGELFLMIKEILNEDVEIFLNKNGYNNHYKITPYSFSPIMSKKLVANPHIDMGQGLLECIKEVDKLKRKNEDKS